MRQILFLLTLALATPALAAPKAPSEQALKEQKAELKETKKVHKKLDRYARKWDKAVAKGKDNKIARFDEKLAGIYQGELARLRGKGIETRIVEETPAPQHPAHPQKVPSPPAPEHPKLEELRDDLVALRDAQRDRAGGKGRVKASERKLLGELQRTIEKRYERQDKRYDDAKQRAKG